MSSIRLAVGSARSGPVALLDPGLAIVDLLRGGRAALHDAVAGATDGPVPEGSRILAPVDRPGGLGGRRDLSTLARGAGRGGDRTVRLRPGPRRRPTRALLQGHRVAGPGSVGEPIGVRADSDWDVPEPELVLVVTSSLEIAGYTLGNDVSSRSIEGENPLYLPQAKVYRWSCAIGPALVPADAVTLPDRPRDDRPP